jgi:serine/threonine protein kinase
LCFIKFSIFKCVTTVVYDASINNCHCQVTHCYRAPETLLGSTHHRGDSVDIFSTGCVAFEMLTGFPLAAEITEISQLKALHDIVVGSDITTKYPEDSTCAPTIRAMERSSSSGDDMLTIYRYCNNEDIEARSTRLFNLIVKHRPNDSVFHHHSEGNSHFCPSPIVSSLLDLISRLISWDSRNRLTATQARNHTFFKQAARAGWFSAPKSDTNESDWVLNRF